MKTTDWIVPASDLEDNLGAILENARQHPLVITDQGRPSFYMVSVDMFDLLIDRLNELERSELVESIAEGERQFSTAQFITLQEAIAEAEARWKVVERSQ